VNHVSPPLCLQCGFALLEAGSVRAKNTKNILLKNVLDACLGGLIWWTIGYPIALGDMGTSETKDDVTQPFFMDRIEGKSAHTYYAMWMFQWAFAATAATIVSVRIPRLLCSRVFRLFLGFFPFVNPNLAFCAFFFLLLHLARESSRRTKPRGQPLTSHIPLLLLASLSPRVPSLSVAPSPPTCATPSP
jgi:hypothetical protein